MMREALFWEGLTSPSTHDPSGRSLYPGFSVCLGDLTASTVWRSAS
jgi:hypothetical protein